MIFERFKTYVVAQVDGFFANRLELRGGELSPIRGERFKALIKQKGQPDGRQHANKEFRAALHWFLDSGAITQEEFDEVERVYLLRNEIGHELLRVVADDGINPLTVMDVLTPFAVYVKVVRWWIKEVEATTDPDMSPEGYDQVDWDQAESSDTVFLRTILQRVLASDSEWGELMEAIKKSPA
jgi:hypothetical protein